MHTRLVKAALGEAHHRGVENLRSPIETVFYLLSHEAWTVNERSFIVKWDSNYDAICFEVRCSPDVALSPSIGSGLGCRANWQIEMTVLNAMSP